MAQIVYECLYLFDSNKYARDAAGVATTANGLIEKCGGEILASRLWKEDRLAYPIDGHRKGAYWLAYFRMESTDLSKFTRECQINDDILRHMVLKIDPRLVDALVAHARGEVVAPRHGESSDGDEASSESEAKADSTTAVS